MGLQMCTTTFSCHQQFFICLKEGYKWWHRDEYDQRHYLNE
jgi:hypothetical protein